jgi:hypothetical protein
MACKIPNINEFLNALKNREYVYELLKSDTRESIVERLRHTQENVVLDEPTHKYGVQDYLFETTATTQVAKKFKKEEKAYDPVITEMGTMVHRYIETRFTGEEFDAKNWNIPEAVRKELDKIAEEITNYANRRQRQIDPDKSPTILTEQKIVNPFQSRSSTADLVIVFSDKSALVYDFKTRILPDKDWKGGRISNTEAISKKYREYEMQLGILGHDLVQNYGVTEIIGGRVIPIPIRLDTAMDHETLKTSFKRSILAVETPFRENTLVKQALLLPEKVNIKGIDKFIKAQYARIRKLEEKSTEATRLEAEQLRDEVADVVLFHNFNTFVDNTQTLYREFLERMNEEEFIDDKPNPKYYDDQMLEELYLKVKAAQVMLTGMSEYVEKMEKSKMGAEKLEKIRGSLGAFMLSLGAMKLNLDSFVANRVVRKRLGDDVFEDEKLKMQRGDGVATGALLGLADQQNFYLRTLNEMKLDNERWVNTNMEQFIEDWAKVNNKVNRYIRENGRTAFINAVFDEKTKNLIKQINPKFFEDRKKAIERKDRAWLNKHYTPIITKEEYEQRKKNYEDKLRLSGLSEKEVSTRMARFVENNDLWGNSLKAWTNNRVVRIADSVYQNREYLTPEYAKLLGTPLEEFYTFYKKSMSRFLRMVDKKETGAAFVPWIRQSMTEAFLNGGMDTKKLRESFLNNIAARNDSSYLSHNDLEKLEAEVPVYFMQPRTDGEGNILPGENKSMDFMNSLLMFGQMAMTHTAAKKNVAIANMVTDSYLDSRVMETDVRGNLKKDGSQVSTRPLTDTEKEFARALRDYYWYGVEMRTKDATFSAFGQEISAIETARTMKRLWTTMTLSFGLKQALGGYVAARANAWIEGSKGIYYNSDQWTKATRLMVSPDTAEKYLALGLYMDIYTDDLVSRKLKQAGMEEKGYWQGQLSDFGRTFQDRRYADFFRRNLSERVGMGIWVYEAERRDNNLVATVAQNYGVDPDGNFFRFKKNMFEKNGTSLKEEYVKMGYKSIWEMFSYDGEEGPGFKNLSKEKNEEIYRSFRQAVKRIRSGISGETNSEDTAYVNLTLWGQLVMHYRSWMPGILREWFGKVRYDNRTLSVHQGRWRVTAKHLFQDGSKDTTAALWLGALQRLGNIIFEISTIPWAYRKLTTGDGKLIPDMERIETEYNLWKENNPDLGEVVSLEDYMEMRIGQLNAMIQELRVIMAMMMFMYGMSLLMGADDDDEDEAAIRFAYSIARKAYSELSFTINPTEYVRMTKNPIPLVSVPEIAVKSLGNTYDEMRDFLMGENSDYDRSGMFFYSRKFIPGYANVDRIMEWSKEGKEYMQNKVF